MIETINATDITNMRNFFYTILFFFFVSGAQATPPLVDRMLQQVYGEDGVTLYCQRPFKSDRVSIDSVYSSHRLRQHFNCRTQRQCEMVPGYLEASEDLHNLYPITRQVELDRRRTLYADLDNVATSISECGYKRAFQNIEPPDHAKGPIARALLYMHERHELPLFGSLNTYQRWHHLSPVNELELRRNDVIEQLQGNRNPFIDDPERANTLRSQSPLQLQFGG